MKVLQQSDGASEQVLILRNPDGSFRQSWHLPGNASCPGITARARRHTDQGYALTHADDVPQEQHMSLVLRQDDPLGGTQHGTRGAHGLHDGRLHGLPHTSCSSQLSSDRVQPAAIAQIRSARELNKVRYTPITQAYKRTAELSWQIARNRGLRASATGESVDGLLVDIAELWELFLLHCAKRAFGPAAVIHGTRLRKANPLLRSKSSAGAVLGRLYPDIIVGAAGRPRAIIDAKYKPLADPRGVDSDDLYQLASYLAGYESDPRPLGMLGYTSSPTRRPGRSPRRAIRGSPPQETR